MGNAIGRIKSQPEIESMEGKATEEQDKDAREFPILDLPYPPLERILHYLNTREKGCLRLVSTRFAELVLLVDLTMRKWTPRGTPESVEAVLHQAKLKGITDLRQFKINPCFMTSQDDVPENIMYRNVIYCEEETSVNAFIANWKDFFVTFYVDYEINPTHFDMPALKKIGYSKDTIATLQSALPFLKANLNNLTRLYIELQDSDLPDIDFELSSLESLTLSLKSNRSHDLSALPRIAKGVTRLLISAEEEVESVDSATLNQVLKSCADNLESLDIRVRCSLHLQLDCSAPNLDNLSLGCAMNEVWQLLEYGRYATSFNLASTWVPELDPGRHSLDNVVNMEVDGEDIGECCRVLGDNLENLKISFSEDDTLEEFDTEKLSKLKSYILIDQSKDSVSEIVGQVFLQKILSSCAITLKRLIICLKDLKNFSHLPVMHLQNLTDLYLDGVCHSWMSAMLDKNDSISYVSVMVDFNFPQDLGQIQTSNKNLREMVLRVRTEISWRRGVDPDGRCVSLATSVEFLALKARFPGVIFSIEPQCAVEPIKGLSKYFEDRVGLVNFPSMY